MVLNVQPCSRFDAESDIFAVYPETRSRLYEKATAIPLELLAAALQLCSSCVFDVFTVSRKYSHFYLRIYFATNKIYVSFFVV